MTGAEQVFAVMRSAKQAYQETMGQLRAKKEEYHEMKRQNEDERKVLLEEERKAKSFKFTKMEKKAAFLPALKEREGFEGY